MRYLPVIAWSKQELMSEYWKHEQAMKNLQKELDRRGDRDEKRWGFFVPIHKSGMITTGYRHYKTPVEAYNAAKEHAEQTDQDVEMAPYLVHPVYLGKEDQ